MQVTTSYTVSKPLNGKFTVTTSTGEHNHTNVGLVYVGKKNLTVCDVDKRAIARYPILRVAGYSSVQPVVVAG